MANNKMTLNEFIEESLKQAASRNFHPEVFPGMWFPKKLPQPIEKFVISSEPKSGFKKMVELGLKNWTLEAAVLAYPDQFSREARVYAEARMNGTLDA